MKESGIPGAGLGVWTVTEIPKCALLGPYVGEVVYKFAEKEDWFHYAWDVSKTA